jgi:hemolysin activation/secretion protein
MERAWMHLKKNSFGQLWKKCIRAACGIILLFVFMNGQSAQAAEEVFTEPATPQQKMIEKIEVEHKAKEAAPAGVREAAAHALVDYLPADDTPKYEVRRIQIQGNQLLTSEQILKKIPPVFDASGQYRIPAEPASLYDLRELAALADDPSVPRTVSARTMQGFTQYILSLYRNMGYSGIYVAVPLDTLAGGKLREDTLLIQVTEGTVSSTAANYFDPQGQKTEKSYLRPSFFEKHSPIKVGEVGKQKKLTEYLNLLNLNPDRYVSAVVSKGEQPDTLAVNYNIYEANPWHWFIQVDNSGTKDRRYAPKVGLIHTNLLGFDDKLTLIHQAPWEKGFEDKYSIFGSYDFPILGPRLRLETYAGYNEFDVEGGGGIDFLGHGSVYGSKLRWNVFQKDDWFFDLTTWLEREKSKVSTSIFSAILGSEVVMHLWGVGADLYRRTDMADTSFSFSRIENVGGSSQRKFWDPIALTGARTDADRDFSVYTVSANHRQYLDPDKVQRLSGSFQWILPQERLVPSRMTTFGGMYSVRGYKESGIIADGGILASVQYEYDLISADRAKYGSDLSGAEAKPFVRKLAPLAFMDFGRARIKDRLVGENNEELLSIGAGGLIELGDHFAGAVYYGFPLKGTSTTDTEDGALNLSLMMRW